MLPTSKTEDIHALQIAASQAGIYYKTCDYLLPPDFSFPIPIIYNIKGRTRRGRTTLRTILQPIAQPLTATARFYNTTCRFTEATGRKFYCNRLLFQRKNKAGKTRINSLITIKYTYV